MHHQDPALPVPAQQFHRDLEILHVSKYLCKAAHLTESHTSVSEEPARGCGLGQSGTHSWGWQCHGQAISIRKAEQGCAPCRYQPPICQETPLSWKKWRRNKSHLHKEVGRCRERALWQFPTCCKGLGAPNVDKHPKPLQLALLQVPISSKGRKALNPQIKQISLFWKHRGCLGWGMELEHLWDSIMVEIQQKIFHRLMSEGQWHNKNCVCGQWL